MTGETRRRWTVMLVLGLGTFAFLFAVDALVLRAPGDGKDAGEGCPWDGDRHASAGVACEACHTQGVLGPGVDAESCRGCHDQDEEDLLEGASAWNRPR